MCVYICWNYNKVCVRPILYFIVIDDIEYRLIYIIDFSL